MNFIHCGDRVVCILFYVDFENIKTDIFFNAPGGETHELRQPAAQLVRSCGFQLDLSNSTGYCYLGRKKPFYYISFMKSLVFCEK